MGVFDSENKKSLNVSKGKKGFQPVVNKAEAPTSNNSIEQPVSNPYVSETADSFATVSERFQAVTFDRPNYAEINNLNSLRRQYFKAVNNGDIGAVLTAEDQIRTFSVNSVDTHFNYKLVLEGKCGIDGCTFPAKGGMSPDHYAGVSCKSGRSNHCTCNSCF